MTDTGKPTVLQVSTSDRAGGAEAVALNLHRALLRRGYTAWLAVGRARLVQEPGVLEIQNGSTAWSSRSWRRYAALMKSQRPRRAAIARAGSVPLLQAIGDGTFGLMKRPANAGKGLDGVVTCAPGYDNPATTLLEGGAGR